MLAKSLASFATTLFDGVALGMILFLISVGLSITMGVMRVVNLAHCGFAMIGGYLCFMLTAWLDLPFLLAVPLAVAATMVIGALLERTVYSWVYGQSELGQVLMTIGLTFVMIAAANAVFGSSIQSIPVPAALRGMVQLGPLSLPVYRLFLVAVSAACGLLIWFALERTEAGAKLRAAVDNTRMAGCIGIDVKAMFAVTFAIGCGFAALGGALGSEIFPLEPFYALQYLVLVLIVVSVGGLGSIKGTLVAALVLGIIDTLGRYYLTSGGGIVLYLATLAVLLIRPQGLLGRPA
ncbi:MULTISPECIES: branched-chain amino acid ABC transporter permease [unclassified Herbaspirillum]|uniref:branched-chain amino acid ABC transporter permease n=1 Tax=unclassified Herbaspirillum TaxID=2624150 RepID=UPI001154114E|nr:MULTISPECIES: branched-chain amino acid ABC transporter permease [unclassified Herbaspirillum]MBB5393784.1 branched-chain amino acid transport system permease protein [Herbaspirillum sp. SJZ102]TQK01356.1 amino acid/amide ABC transporter membrane protein 1 (HAAT family) [Herbaspirillum sp. SJZ130]TQK05752.1 amino acid/amide ABC transporter membrane protein 1 (HAAT family) [Herbaspirillum sp. SJZ106]TWC65124.1 amino acid/amide ABC transporter membrane protein 1 (HAAT family) [Herbaspirillum s